MDLQDLLDKVERLRTELCEAEGELTQLTTAAVGERFFLELNGDRIQLRYLPVGLPSVCVAIPLPMAEDLCTAIRRLVFVAATRG